MRYADENATPVDFVPRRRIPTMVQFGLIFTLFFLLIVLAHIITETVFTFGAVVSFILCIVAALVVLNVQRARDLVLATEFQNAMFASALGVNNKFCIIIRRDGSIAYVDRGLQELFPELERMKVRTLDALLELGRVSRDETAKVLKLVDAQDMDRVLFSMRSSDGRQHRILLSMDPIMRPQNFLLLRARDYIEQRNVDDATDMDSLSLLSKMMDKLNAGIYIANGSGKLSFVNSTLNSMLGYGPGELVQQNAHISTLLLGANATDAQNMELQPFEGEVTLKMKNGNAVRSFVQQDIMRSPAGNVVCCAALIYPANKKPV